MRRISILAMSCVVLVVLAATGLAQEITQSIVSRVFCLKYGSNFGSCFTIDVDDKQYLVTAEHVVKGICDGDSVQILQGNHWTVISVRIISVEPTGIDMIVLVPPVQMSPAFPLDITMHNLTLSQNMYFLGFPMGLGMDGGSLNQGYPIPLVKGGICSAIMIEEGYRVIVVDALNNPGFSGGPIVFVDRESKKLKVAGVIRGFVNQNDTVYQVVEVRDRPQGTVDSLRATDMVVKSNTGLVVGFDIQNAVDAIRKNPIGPNIGK